MKTIYLNTWGGRLENPFFDFISKELSDVSVFCFTEVNPQLFEALKGKLASFQGLFALDKTLENSLSSQAVFVKNGLLQSYEKILLNGAIVYSGSVGSPSFIQRVSLKGVTLFNLHGLTFPGDKLDTNERLLQSKKILEFSDRFDGPKIIGGDFNLMPDTKSISMFEESGYRNLIKDFKIQTTRNRLADHTKNDKEYFGKQDFADYVFISSDVKVNSFEVPKVEISDHLPMILNFEI